MLELTYDFIDKCSNPTLVSGRSGGILYQNSECGVFFRDLLGKPAVDHLTELGFNASISPRADRRYKLKYGAMPLFCRIHSCRIDGSERYLVIFDKCNYVSPPIAAVLECIDDALVVMDSGGMVKFTNTAFQKYSGMDSPIGQVMHEHFASVRYGLEEKFLNRSPGLEALRQKRWFRCR